MYARKLKSYSYVNKNMILKVKHFSIDLISVECFGSVVHIHIIL